MSKKNQIIILVTIGIIFIGSILKIDGFPPILTVFWLLGVVIISVISTKLWMIWKKNYKGPVYGEDFKKRNKDGSLDKRYKRNR